MQTYLKERGDLLELPDIWNAMCFNKNTQLGNSVMQGTKYEQCLSYLLSVISVHKASLFYSDVIKNFNLMANALVFITHTSSNLCIPIWLTWAFPRGRKYTGWSLLSPQ